MFELLQHYDDGFSQELSQNELFMVDTCKEEVRLAGGEGRNQFNFLIWFYSQLVYL